MLFNSTLYETPKAAYEKGEVNRQLPMQAMAHI